jgi:hypothetical protein
MAQSGENLTEAPLEPAKEQLPTTKKRQRSFNMDDEKNWNNRWNVADSKGNGTYHPFYKEYFGKKIKATDGNFVFSYA